MRASGVPAGLVWHQCACALYGIAEGVWHYAQACIRISLRLDSIRDFVAIPYRTSCGFHTRLWRDWDAKGDNMAKNLLLEYSEQLACDIAILCNENKIDSNTVYQIKKSSSSVFANISEAQYPQSLADMLSKFEIARKECMETESWLKLMLSSGCIDEMTFKKHRNLCGRFAGC